MNGPRLAAIRSFSERAKTFSIDKYTEKKENQIFLIYKEIQSGTVAKSYEEGLPNI